MIVNSVEPMQVDDMNESEAMATTSGIQPDQPNGVGDYSTDFTVGSCSIDLDLYVTQYTEMYRLQRLVFIAHHCPSMQLDALKSALQFAQETNNVEMYKRVHTLLNDYFNSNGTVSATGGADMAANQRVNTDSVAANQRKALSFSQAWVDEALKAASTRFEKLDSDLRSYKSNSIKESIRRGHCDMGKHYLQTGDLQLSLKSFSRARDYCTSSKHVIEMCFNVIGVNMLLKNWFHVQNYVLKAEQTPDVADSQSKKAQSKAAWLKCAYGLAELAFSRYKSAARAFLNISVDNCPEDFISPSNVAVYGGLCALASYDRSELHKNVLSNTNFKQLLEIEPQLREIISCFYNSNYANCFSMLDEMKNNWLLDIYLSSHVTTLYSLIRERALCQYFGPYTSIDMNKMAGAFNTTVDALQEELSLLIQNDMINGRIDSHNKIVFAREVNQRNATFEKALALGQEYERRSTAMLARCAVAKAQLVVAWRQGEGGTERSIGNFSPPLI